MSDNLIEKNCPCGGSSRASTQNQATSDPIRKLVSARIPQDYDAKFNIRLVPARSLEKALQVEPSCKPRGNVTGWDHAKMALDEALVATLSKADKTMVAWLAKDTANAQRFLQNPVAAMHEAGVKLSRAEEKVLARANEAASGARVVGPSINVASLSVQTYPTGRVGAIGSGKTDGNAEDFTCGPKTKG